MATENAKVLLVDDDKDLLQLIAMRLTAAGYAVTAVESGEAALAALAVSRPQVVVTDLRMQGMDGMALFDAIHRDSPSLPVVILTGHGTVPSAAGATPDRGTQTAAAMRPRVVAQRAVFRIVCILPLVSTRRVDGSPVRARSVPNRRAGVCRVRAGTSRRVCAFR